MSKKKSNEQKPTTQNEEREERKVVVAPKWANLRQCAKVTFTSFIVRGLEVPMIVLNAIRRDVRLLRRFRTEPDEYGNTRSQYGAFREEEGARVIGIYGKPYLWNGRDVSAQIFGILFDDEHAVIALQVKCLQDALGVKLNRYHMRAFMWLYEQCRTRLRGASPEFKRAFRSLESFLGSRGSDTTRDSIWIELEAQAQKKYVPTLVDTLGNGPTTAMLRADFRLLREGEMTFFRMFRSATTVDEAYGPALQLLQKQAELDGLRGFYPEAKSMSPVPEFVLTTRRVQALSRLRLAKVLADDAEIAVELGINSENFWQRARVHEAEAAEALA